jgi:hypothetical protein
MYFEDETIEAELNCPFCKQRFVDPRMLPCGNFCCFECIKRELNADNSYKCDLCDNVHETRLGDGNQYPVPHLLNNLLKKMDIKVSPEFIKLEFKKEFEKFKSKINDSSNLQLNFKNKLNDYCNTIRCEVITKTESAINNLNNICNELCKTIDAYEDEKSAEWDNENALTSLISYNRQIEDDMIQLYHKTKAKENEILRGYDQKCLF